MKCVFCDSPQLTQPIYKDSYLQKQKIAYYHCKACGSIHQEPLPDEHLIQKYYQSYLEIKKEMNPGYLENQQLQALFNERDKTFREIKFDNHWLKKTVNVELGCANGHFLEYLAARGAKTIIGIDISRNLLDKIKIDNVRLLCGNLSQLEEKSIDNLFLFNILEHIRDLSEQMLLITSRLKPLAKVVIELPLTGWISSFFAHNWRFLMPDEHLHLPSMYGFKQFCKHYNFKIIGKTRFGSGYTSGMIPFPIKSRLDFLAKFLAFGDRAAFLCEYQVSNHL